MRAVRWIAIGLLGLALAIALWLLGLTIYYRPLAGPELPFGQLYVFIAGEAWGRVYCGVTGCPVELPEGMTSRVWDEHLLRSTPVALDVDEQGRLYVAEADRNQGGVADNRSHKFWLLDDLASHTVEDRRAYYEKWLAAGKLPTPDWFTSRSDRVIRLADTNGDGVADERKDLIEFHDVVDGLAAGVLWLDGELWITSIPRLVKLRDADGDGIPEQREDLATGFGVKSSLIGHDLHGLTLGPDGKIYFSSGDRGYFVKTREGRTLEPPLDPGRGAVFRIDRDGSNLEVFATGLRNPQELAFDDYGNLFTGENNSDSVDEARIAYLVQGGDAGWAMPYQSMTDPAYPRAMWVAERLWETQHEGQPAWIVPPIGYLGRGPAGFAHYPGTGLPDSYRGRFFLADYRYTPARSAIWSFGVAPAGAGFRVVDAQPFIRQVVATDLAFGFDGRIFVSPTRTSPSSCACSSSRARRRARTRAWRRRRVSRAKGCGAAAPTSSRRCWATPTSAFGCAPSSSSRVAARRRASKRSRAQPARQSSRASTRSGRSGRSGPTPWRASSKRAWRARSRPSCARSSRASPETRARTPSRRSSWAGSATRARACASSRPSRSARSARARRWRR